MDYYIDMLAQMKTTLDEDLEVRQGSVLLWPLAVRVNPDPPNCPCRS